MWVHHGSSRNCGTPPTLLFNKLFLLYSSMNFPGTPWIWGFFSPLFSDILQNSWQKCWPGSEEEEDVAGNRQVFSRIHTDVSRNGADSWEFNGAVQVGCLVSHFTLKEGHFKAIFSVSPHGLIDWIGLLGKIWTGNHMGFYHSIYWGFPVNFPLNQPSDWCAAL